MSLSKIWHNLSYINYIFLKGLGLKLKGAHFHGPQFFCTYPNN